MILTFKYRLLPSKKQHEALKYICEQQRLLYNAALEERVDYFKKTGHAITLYDQQKSLTQCRRELPEMAALPTWLQRWTLTKLDEAYRGFFNRLRSKKKSGFPRFKSKSRWDSFGIASFGHSAAKFDGKRIRFQGMPGGLRVHITRPLPNDVRSCVFKRDQNGWVIYFQAFVQEREKVAVEVAIGIDLGLSVFSYASDGVVVPNPRIARRAEKELRRRQRALSRCKRGSGRRLKIKAKLTTIHRRIVNIRTTWLHQQSRALVDRADLIVVEDLNVAEMMQNSSLAKSIHDVSWSTFIRMVAYKAEEAGKYLVKVDPKNTSKRCSCCGELVYKSLWVRTHSCSHCGLVIDRDYNASLNILAALAGRGEQNVVQWDKRALGNLKLVMT